MSAEKYEIRVSNRPSARCCGVYGCTGESKKEIDLGHFRFRLCNWHAQDLAELLVKRTGR